MTIKNEFSKSSDIPIGDDGRAKSHNDLRKQKTSTRESSGVKKESNFSISEDTYCTAQKLLYPTGTGECR